MQAQLAYAASRLPGKCRPAEDAWQEIVAQVRRSDVTVSVDAEPNVPLRTRGRLGFEVFVMAAVQQLRYFSLSYGQVVWGDDGLPPWSDVCTMLDDCVGLILADPLDAQKKSRQLILPNS